jgi:polyhydroxybutyrate depolymerase
MAKRAPFIFTICLALQVGAATADRMDFGSVTRTYTAVVPEQKPAPLVVVLHGNTQQGADMMSRTSWPEVARRERFAVVFPDGLNRSWADLRARKERIGRMPPEGTDDIAFLSALIEMLIADGIADAKRIYVTGLSNGGAMTMSLVCTRANTFAAAAAVIINLTDGLASACRPARPVPLLLMNGTQDPLVPFNGGKGSSWFAVDGFWSTAKTVQFWRDKSGCAPADAASADLPDRDPGDGSTVTLISSTCPPQRDVLLYRVDGGGHRFPGRLPDARMRRLADSIFGTQNHDIDGPEVIWEFFQKFQRP